jgi:O-antigen ligase
VFNDPQAHGTAIGRYRRALAFIRLLLLYTLLCFLVLYGALAWRQVRESGWGLDNPLPPVDSPGQQIPFLGITIELLDADPATQQADLQRLQESGFGWVRQRFEWAALEPEPGQYTWEASDALLSAIASAGLTPVALLDGSPAWARRPLDTGATDNPLAPPADPASFARFAAAFAERYGDGVRFYQVWDEPNIAPHWGNRHIEPVEYAQLLKAAATAIRGADDNAAILLAALAPTADRGHTAIDEVYFLHRLYAAGAAPYFDAVAVQSYGFGARPDDGRARLALLNFQRVKLVRRAMLSAGDGATPIWLVRYGWNTRPDSPWRTVSPADQVQFAGAALTLAAHEWPWLAAMGWMIDRPATPSADPMWGFALTPELSQTFRHWTPPPAADAPVLTAPPLTLPPLALLVLTGVVVLWRGKAAAAIVPWRGWLAWWRTAPAAAQIVAWVALAGAYYFAVWPPLVVLCWLAAAFLVAAQPLAGLGLAAALLPFYFQHKEVKLVDATLTAPPAVVLLACLIPPLIGRIDWRRSLHLHRDRSQFDWLAVLWLAISLISMVNVWHWPAYWHGLVMGVIAPLVGYVAIRTLVDTAAAQRQIVTALFAGGLLVALLGLVDWLRGGGTEADGVLRLVGPYFSPNHTALYLVRTLFLGMGLALAARGGRTFWAVACGAVAVALLLTASRGAWLLGVPAGLVFLLWVWLRQRREPVRANLGKLRPPRARWLRPSAAVVVGIGGVATLLSASWSRLTNSETVLSRLHIWQATLRLWTEAPWFGVGPGGFFWRYPAYVPPGNAEINLLHPHNVWLETGVTWGLLGLAWLVVLGVLIGCVARRLLQRQSAFNWLTIGLVAGLVAAMAHAQVDAFWSLPDLALWNWLAIGALENRGWGARSEV